jgi:hypothetical protein
MITLPAASLSRISAPPSSGKGASPRIEEVKRASSQCRHSRPGGGGQEEHHARIYR